MASSEEHEVQAKARPTADAADRVEATESPDVSSDLLPDSSGHSSDPLVVRLQAGEDAAFEILVRTHLPRMRAVVTRITGDRDADDVVQNAFLSAFKALPSFRGDAQLGTWLHRIAVNAALMHMRRRKPAAELPNEHEIAGPQDSGNRGRQDVARHVHAKQSVP